MANPVFDKNIYQTPAQLERAKQLHIIMMGIFKYFNMFKSLPEINNSQEASKFLNICKEIVKENQEKEIQSLQMERLDENLVINIANIA